MIWWGYKYMMRLWRPSTINQLLLQMQHYHCDIRRYFLHKMFVLRYKEYMWISGRGQRQPGAAPSEEIWSLKTLWQFSFWFFSPTEFMPGVFWQTGRLSVLCNLTNSRCQGRKHNRLSDNHPLKILKLTMNLRDFLVIVKQFIESRQRNCSWSASKSLV